MCSPELEPRYEDDGLPRGRLGRQPCRQPDEEASQAKRRAGAYEAEVSHAGPETSTTECTYFVSLVGHLRLQEHGTAKFEVTNKFSTSYDVVEEQLKSSTVGMAMTCYYASLVPQTLLLRNRVW